MNTFPIIAKQKRLILIMVVITSACRVSCGQHTDTRLFDSDEVLEITISGNIRQALHDRSSTATYHNMNISYLENDKVVTTPVRVKTRGHFRLSQGNCSYPPLMLNFSKKSNTTPNIFTNLNKIKLVTPCRDDRFVIREYLVYKIYNLVTEKSFKARLARVSYDDTVKLRATEPLYGILLEEDVELAKRHHCMLVEDKPVRPEDTHQKDFLKLAVFEYLIGNTDWSVQYQQNIKLVSTDSVAAPTAVAYDFDHAGIVRAPYAKPATELNLQSVLNRRYRGYCVDDMKQFDEVFGFFNSIQPKLYALYRECSMLDEGYVKSTIKYLDEFYATINDSKKSASEFMYPCDAAGTGNVVIRGLKK